MSPEIALRAIENLANGIHPDTGEVLDHDSVFNNSQVIRALNVAVKLIEQSIKREARKAARPASLGTRWTDEEDAELLTALDSKMLIKDIASKHGRSRFAIEARLVKLGRGKE